MVYFFLLLLLSTDLRCATDEVHVVYRLTHIAVDHVTSTNSATLTSVTPVIFVTSLEGHVFKYAQLTQGGGTARACLVEVLDLGCDGSGRTTPRSMLLDADKVRKYV